MRLSLLLVLLALGGCFTLPVEGPDPARNYVPPKVRESSILGKNSGWPSHCPPDDHQNGWC